MTDLKELAARQRAKMTEVVSDTVDVVLGGEKITLEVERLHPDDWDALMIANPARPGSKSDAEAGYNTKAVTLAYPRLKLNGEALTADQIKNDLYADLESPWRNAIAIVIWGVNVNHALVEMRALGKASAGRKSPSPAN